MKNNVSRRASSKEALAARLGGIIDACERAARRHERAAREVSNPELSLLFRRYARRRHDFARELSEHAQRLQGDGALLRAPEANWSVERAAPRAPRALPRRSAPSRRDDATILQEGELGEAALRAMYDAAFACELPDDLPIHLRRQFLAVVDAYDQIHQLRAALAWCDVPMAV